MCAQKIPPESSIFPLVWFIRTRYKANTKGNVFIQDAVLLNAESNVGSDKPGELS